MLWKTVVLGKESLNQWKVVAVDNQFSKRKVNLSIGRMREKDFCVLSRISSVNSSFIGYVTGLEDNINYGMRLK